LVGAYPGIGEDGQQAPGIGADIVEQVGHDRERKASRFLPAFAAAGKAMCGTAICSDSSATCPT
jgi:hypothetical protein